MPPVASRRAARAQSTGSSMVSTSGGAASAVMRPPGSVSWSGGGRKRPSDTCQDGPVPELEPSLQALAEAYGIATDYWDWQGRHVEVGRETVVAGLAALGVDASTSEAAARALEEKHRLRWSQM